MVLLLICLQFVQVRLQIYVQNSDTLHAPPSRGGKHGPTWAGKRGLTWAGKRGPSPRPGKPMMDHRSFSTSALPLAARKLRGSVYCVLPLSVLASENHSCPAPRSDRMKG